jgi:hypothetical protein
MSRRALRSYTGSTSTRRALSLKLPPKLARFCRNVGAGVWSVAGPYLGVMCIVVLGHAAGLVVTVRRVVIATLTLALVGAPAMADTTFRCEDGTTVVLYEVGREMRINGIVGGFSVALPLAHAYGDTSVWTPRTFYEEDETCTPDYAPCVEYRFPAGGPDTLTYQLSETSVVVRCAPEPERL